MVVFPSHFPDDPNVPGFIQVEALTQMFLMTFLSYDENKGKKRVLFPLKMLDLKRRLCQVKHYRSLLNLTHFEEEWRRGEQKALWTMSFL